MISKIPSCRRHFMLYNGMTIGVSRAFKKCILKEVSSKSLILTTDIFLFMIVRKGQTVL